MKASSVALVARADKSRGQLARYLRDAGYDVFESEELAIVAHFVGVVLVDDQEARQTAQARVQAWVKPAKQMRVVVVSTKPAAWRTLSLAFTDNLVVLAAPAFGWEIVDALRAVPSPDLPDRT